MERYLGRYSEAIYCLIRLMVGPAVAQNGRRRGLGADEGGGLRAGAGATPEPGRCGGGATVRLVIASDSERRIHGGASEARGGRGPQTDAYAWSVPCATESCR